MGKKPFIDRKQAKHYHLVHRSQKDPLINDSEASDRVLHEVIPSNLHKHKTKEEIQAIKHKPVELTPDEIDRRVGQAAMHGIYFDDTAEYDYTQHLRAIGESTEAVFLEAPKKEEKPKRSKELEFRDKKGDIELPADVLPSNVEMSVGVMNQSSGLEGGLQPDMDPRLREIMEALEDEEYVDEELDDDFFEELNAEGDPYVPDDEEEEYYEEEEVMDENGGYDWRAAFRNFKRQQDRRQADSDDEFEDDLVERRSRMTGFSVSSSAMHRNPQLTLLDARFDKIEEEYMNDNSEDEEFEGELLEERADFEDILDDFLDKYEIVGRKMQPKLDGETAEQKLDKVREALLATTLSDDEDKASVSTVRRSHTRNSKDSTDNVEIWERPVKYREAWDCQSVLSTYSNLENHPKLISDRGPKKKILIDSKTGMPSLVQVDKKNRKPRQEELEKVQEEEEEEAGSGEDEEEQQRINTGIPRSKNETKEEKRARKAAVKEAKRNRREAKKNTKEAFKQEENRQRKTLQQQRKTKGTTHIP
ncbi:hypothetical protein VTP01DRAFT_7098 [Rhizomucor pusillus]|uniref:uncharacterized protein n=1 Tax=Rhizomucor pusillus TaxID=4840 RepID=UPI0037448315